MTSKFNNKVVFAVENQNGQVKHEEIIKFSKIIANVGNDFNKDTGEFTTNIPGLYMFTLSGESNLEKHGLIVHVRKNGVKEFEIGYHSNNLETHFGNKRIYESIASSWVMRLNSQDIVTLYTYYNGFYTSSAFPLIFTGALLIPDE